MSETDPTAPSPNSRKHASLADLIHNERTAWVVLAVSLLITALGWKISSFYVHERAQEAFDFQVEDARDRIIKRMQEYEQVLRGGVALQQTMHYQVNRDDWQHYVETLELETYFPGIQGIGYAEMIKPAALETHIQRIRQQGFTNYTVKPAGEREMYSAIVFLEPFDWRNQRAFGYDMFSNPVRREAMITARDSGEPAISGKVILVQETEQDVQAGFLMYLPLYDIRLPLNTVEQRRNALLGYVYSPFRMNDLMAGILGVGSPSINFKLYDNQQTFTTDTRLYDSAPQTVSKEAGFQTQAKIDLPGRSWTAFFSSRPGFDKAMESSQPTIIAISGITVDVLLFLVILSIARQRKKVEKRARKITQQLCESNQRLTLSASVFDHAHEAIMLTDARTNIIDVNPTFTLITGYSRDEVIGEKANILKSDQQPEDFYADMWRDIMHKGYWQGEIWNKRKNGETFAELLTISAVYENSNTGDKKTSKKVSHYVGIFSDITRLKTQQTNLEKLAKYDPLTQLPNRVLLADRLKQSRALTRRGGQHMAVCYLDLDNFKPINDQYGHHAGDLLLVQVAKRLSDNIRETDTASRLGGDEFVLILNQLTDLKECELTLERILRSLNKPFQLTDQLEVSIAASIGFTLYPDDDVDSDTLLRHADQAMYTAKQHGRNQYVLFDHDHDREKQLHLAELIDLEKAFTAEQFTLYFQPKVDMRHGEVTGFEALIRWQHPELGILPPSQFLPLIENTALSIQLGEWVLEQAFNCLNEWKKLGLDTKVSVNISGYHLQQLTFIELLKNLLKKYPAVQGEQLILEILETTALEDVALASKVMTACSKLGISFSLDDFGTGYSSLTYLKRLPAQTLKIDQSFVIDMLDDPEQLAIVEGIIGLAHAFHLDIIAEGVETIEHGTLLLRLGCDNAQGYGIARPMPANRVIDWIEHYQLPDEWVSASEFHWSSNNLPLLSAEIEHRRWVDDLIAAVTSENSARPVPELDHNQCNFARWYNGIGEELYGQLSSFQEIRTIHENIHSLGMEIVKYHKQGEQQAVLSRLPILRDMRGEIQHRLLCLRAAVINHTPQASDAPQRKRVLLD